GSRSDRRRLLLDRLCGAGRRREPCPAHRDTRPADAAAGRGADRRNALDRQYARWEGIMTEEDFRRYVAAFNANDFEGFGHFYADDVVFELGAMKRIVGRENILSFYREVKAHIVE